MEEIWKDIPGYEGLYQASNLGKIRSLNYNKTGKVRERKPTVNAYGYCQLSLKKKGTEKGYRVNRLVWETFNGPIPDGYEINHINEDKTDNRLENLSLMTHMENMNWGTGIERMMLKRTGKNARKPVYQYSTNKDLLYIWPSELTAATKLNIKQTNISACCLGKLKTYKGFIWSHSLL